jgi:hypothetical protein
MFSAVLLIQYITTSVRKDRHICEAERYDYRELVMAALEQRKECLDEGRETERVELDGLGRVNRLECEGRVVSKLYIQRGHSS